MEIKPVSDSNLTVSSKRMNVSGGKQYVSLRLEGLSNSKVGLTRDVVFVLDNSGSMAGAAFDRCKQGVMNLYTQIKDISSVGQIRLVVYNTDVATANYDMRSDPNINSLSAMGATDFVKVFGHLGNLIGSLGSDVVVIFFTDGCDTMNGRDCYNATGWSNSARNTHTTNREAVRAASDTLKACTLSMSKTVEYHTIGVNSEHDSFVLDNITKMGQVEGTYQQASTCEITDALMKMQEHISQSYTAVTLNGVKVALTCVADGEFTGYLVGDFTGETLVVNVDGNDFPVVPSEDFTEAERCENALNVIADRLRGFVSSLKDCFDLSSKVPELQVIETDLNVLAAPGVGSIWKLDRLVRKRLMPECEPLYKLIADVFHTVRNSRTVSHQQFAALNTQTYAVAKRGLQKKLDKRSEANQRMLETLEDDITKVKATIDFTKLPNVEVDSCAISCQSWSEALEEGDCLCLGLSVKRSDAAVADASQLQITGVYPTMVTANTFLESMEYAFAHSGSAVNVHGGFGRKEGKVVTGSVREDISGILPLYLCADNWKVAKMRMRPVMGWMCTLDILGYNYDQVKVVPFSVLAYLMNRNDEFSCKMYRLVLETCQQIWKDALQNFSRTEENPVAWPNEILEQYKNYCMDHKVRLPEFVRNYRLFLAYIRVATSLDSSLPIPAGGRFYEYLEEEEHRRHMSREQQNTFIFSVWNVLNIPRECYQPELDDHRRVTVSNTSQSASAQEAAFVALLGETVDQPKVFREEVLNFLAPEQQVDSRFDELCKRVRVKKVRVPWVTSCFGDEYISIFDRDPVQAAAIYIQNCLHRTNEKRREEYTDLLSSVETARKYLRDLFVADLTEYIKSQKTCITTEIMNKRFQDNAGLFASTSNLNEAAGCLLGTFVGRGLDSYINALETQVCPLVGEKVKMLRNGEYRGVELLGDLKKQARNCKAGRYNPNPTPGKWNPSQRNIYKIWFTNRDQLSQEEWRTIFDNNQRAIDCRYDLSDTTVYQNAPNTGHPIPRGPSQ